MVLVLCAFLSIASYAGTSVLFGAFLAGAFLTYIPSKHPEGPFVVMSREEGEKNEHKSPTFVHTFELYFLDAQNLWTGEAIWRGVVFTLLQLFGKVVVGIWVPLWDLISKGRKSKNSDQPPSKWSEGIIPAIFLGSAMVARGEIGLLIVQIGYNDTPYVSDSGFYTAIWAILLNTIIGPVVVGSLVKMKGETVGRGKWGLVDDAGREDEKADENGDSTERGMENGTAHGQ